MDTNQPTQMDGYVRVSRVMGREGDSFQSPDQQREVIETWAKMRSVEIVAWHQDLDISGGTLVRPGLDTLMERIRRGQTGGVVVAKLDRLSRAGVADALKLVEEIREHGGQIAAPDLGIDPTTPFGEFALTLLLALARMERARLMESWQIAKASAIERGVHIGPTPFGYRRQMNGDDPIKGMPLVVDEVTGPIVTELFKRAADSIQDASKYLAKQAPHKATDPGHLRRILSNRVYLGEVAYGDRINSKAHAPLTTNMTWEKAQSTGVRRATAQPFPLSGIVTCAGCGESMVGGRGGKNKRTYRCRSSLTSWKGERCTSPANIIADRLEGYVDSVVLKTLDGLTVQSLVAVDPEELEAAKVALDDAQAALTAFANNARAITLLGVASWENALETYAQEVQRATDAYHAMAGQVRFGKPGEDVPYPALFTTLEPQFKRTFYQALVKASVQRGRATVEERVALEPLDAAILGQVVGMFELLNVGQQTRWLPD